MTRDENKKELGEIREKCAKCHKQKLFFARMQAATQQDWPFAFDAQSSKPFRKMGPGIGFEVFGVIFHAPGHDDSIRGDAEALPAFGIGLILRKECLQTPPEKGLADRSQFCVTLF